MLNIKELENCNFMYFVCFGGWKAKKVLRNVCLIIFWIIWIVINESFFYGFFLSVDLLYDLFWNFGIILL